MENTKLNTILKVSVIIGIILISISAFYYFIVKPHNEQIQLNKIIEESKNQITKIADDELRQKDLERIDTIKYIRMSFELYYEDYSEYPDFIIQGNTQYRDSDTMTIPVNPIPTLGGICSKNIKYIYKSLNNRQDYQLDYCLEKGFGEYDEGIYRATSFSDTELLK